MGDVVAIKMLFGLSDYYCTVAKTDYPRDILNRLKWEEGQSLDHAEIIILHRGAPGDRRTISGKEILSIGQLFFETSETSIPFHRILEIIYRGEKIFKKEPKKSK